MIYKCFKGKRNKRKHKRRLYTKEMREMKKKSSLKKKTT